MKPAAGLALVILVVTLLIGGPSISSAQRFAPPAGTTTQAATRFSSGYTALTKCGSGMTKKEEKEAAAQSSDIPTRCKGYGGYDVYIYYSACSSIFSLEK